MELERYVNSNTTLVSINQKEQAETDKMKAFKYNSCFY